MHERQSQSIPKYPTEITLSSRSAGKHRQHIPHIGLLGASSEQVHQYAQGVKLSGIRRSRFCGLVVGVFVDAYQLRQVMKPTIKSCLTTLFGALLLNISVAVTTHAESWPTKQIRLVVPYPPGASTDAVSREVALRLSANLGQPVVVENRPGASGTTGVEQVSRSAPDGYTFVLGTNATHGLVQLLSKRQMYDPVNDFSPLTPVAVMPLALVAHPSVPASNAAQIIVWAKANVGKVSYATPGLGTPHHLAGELLNQMAGGGMIHVPYKGTGQSITDLLGGQIPIAFASLSTVLPHAQSGKLKIIGMVESQRQAGSPTIPTIGESLPGYAIPQTWLGFFAPPQMPPALVTRMNAELDKAINAPEVMNHIHASGLQAISSSPQDFVKTLRDDLARFSVIIKAAGIVPE